MPAKTHNRPSRKLRPIAQPSPAAPKSPPPPVAIVVSRYNRTVTDKLLHGAVREYARAGGYAESLVIVNAPGAFELTALCHAAAHAEGIAGVVALGCIIKGETRHDRYLADAVANGLTAVTLQTGIPVAFGVLTVDSAKQALARAGGEHGNKGEEAMAALLDTIAEIRRLHEGVGGPASSRALTDKVARAAKRTSRKAR